MTRSFTFMALAVLLVAALLRISALSTLPPGPHFDEAANILITRSIAFDGANLFPIANSYQGRESLYFYLNIPVFHLIGDDVFALRISSLWMNLLTIAAAMGLGRAMFRGRRAWLMGAGIGVMMAISFHQIFMSRQAYRAVSLPLMQALALLFLWRGLTVKRHDWIWLALGGLFAGGAIYTYMASRLFAVWLGISGLTLLWADRQRWRLRLRQGVVFFGVMLLTMTPMLLYALDNPDIFFQRLDEVTDGEVSVSLAESIRLHVEMFFIRGDAGNLRYNDPGRPYFTAPEGVLLLVGLCVAAWRLFRKDTPPLHRAAYVLALLSPLMVIPSVISVAGLPPSHMRSLGMVPLIFLVAAIGFEAVWTAIEKRWTINLSLTSAALTGVLVLGAILVRDDYMTWAKRADLFYQADGDLATAVEWLENRVDPDMRVYVASFHREHPTWITAWDDPVTWLGGDSLFLPPPDEQAIAIFARNAPPNDAWLPLIASGQIDDVPQGPDGDAAFWAYTLDASMASDIPADAVSNPLLTLIDASVTPTSTGETANVVMTWHINQTPPYYRLRPVVNMTDGNNATISSTDVFLLGTDSWQPGETMIQQVPIMVPHGTPPGRYTLNVAWVDRDTDTYITYGTGATQATITSVEITRPDTFPSADALPIIERIQAQLAPGINLLGWNPIPDSARPGETLRPVLFWQGTESAQNRDGEQIGIELVSDAGETVPLPGFAYDPDNWTDGELITDRPLWPILADTEPGAYAVRVTGSDSEITLGQVDIVGIPRVMDAPPVAEQLNLQLGDTISLYGHTLTVDETIEVELVWRADATNSVDYKIFVHLLDESGNIIAQHDTMPQNWSYPTTLWVQGEYVIDPYSFALAQNAQAVRIGMYLPETGTRLPVFEDGTKLENDFLVIPMGS